jgi:hypothetical protein
MDTQLVELIGKNYLTAELLRANLEVAIPIRDRGIDLIAYADVDERLQSFVSCPIQMKAAMQRSFSLDKKYERVRNLLIVYVWHLHDLNQTITYALTYEETLKIAEEIGWTRTISWERGSYANTKPSAKIISMLEPYKMNSEKWWQKITGLIQ